MFKHIVAFLIIISLLIIPINAASDVCPVQTPYIVYVTVPVPVPVTVYLTPVPTIPIQTPTSIPTTIKEQSIFDLSPFEKYMEVIYGGLLLSLLIGVIFMISKKGKRNTPIPNKQQQIKQRKKFKLPAFPKLFKKKPQEVKNVDRMDLFEEDNKIEESKPIEDKPQKKPKKKKPKSLLDQDFEF